MCVCGEDDCTIPEGKCHCGCGGDVSRADRTRSERGHVRGQFYKCLPHHQPRVSFKYEIDENGCWIWQRGMYQGGYGHFRDNYAHRASYEMHVGPIPDGLVIDHLCRVRACVNPSHMEPVTSGENTKRGSHVKLRPCEVEEIRRLRGAGVSKPMIAKMFRISSHHVYVIATRRAWAEVA